LSRLGSTYYAQVVLMGITPVIMSICSIPIWVLIYVACSKKNKDEDSKMKELTSNNTDGDILD
jgi:hypothetical protein